MKNRLKISNLYPIEDILDSTTPKIFDYLANDEDFDFLNADNIDTLNTDYYLSHSNDKYISPLVEKLLKNGKSASEISSMVASICKNRFGEKWVKIYSAITEEYNPLENYSMVEERTPDLSYHLQHLNHHRHQHHL